MKIVFYGAGNMASAIFEGIISSSLLNSHNIYLTNRSSEGQLQDFQQKLDINYSYDDDELLTDADYVFLATKPYDFDALSERIKDKIQPGNHFVSIMAGVPINQIKNKLQMQNPIARIMPNTNAQVQQSVTGITFSDTFDAGHKAELFKILNSFGTALEVEEEKLHQVTAITGSGPAFLYYMYEQYIKAAIHMGLDKEHVDAAVRNLIIGTGHMLEASELDIEQLRENITSKGGTTKAGLDALKKYPVEDIFTDCLEQAIKRSKELSE
ncbi:pyrroline-5-carboxylate reductase [Macrococcus hajekii]|uniref:Pyrroline-5-carboxylate reductase n=1 Tax=Macrococcus hajekii TaxID=198482 RepID=A0A4R6BMB3_9STAP|nr:pyrroline-5-carboxylate reductase [Macrococcus hajekii]TDM02950.1 pyrroline-5-carboxylate reductase [Macrococcus hajekii]GGB05211.1 pyrroline-5-carboxylate reductase [Macrococcus hajekii]